MSRRRSIAIDIVIAAMLFLVGAEVARFVGRHYTGPVNFYQEEFGPAVMVAVGRGFVEPVVTAGSPLDDFLRRRRSELSVDEGRVRQTGPPSLFQHSERYLMTAVAYWWRAVGISWPAVWAVAAVLYGLTIAAVYAIFRVWLPRMWAIAGASFICLSPIHLAQLPNVRDFSKAPFMLWAIPLIAIVALRPMSRGALLMASAACGAIVGIGLGFRLDVAIMAPLFLASLVLFHDRRPWSGLREKGLAVGVFLLAYVAAAAPIVWQLSGGSNSYHVVLLGYSEPYYANLHIRPSLYRFGLKYDDGFVDQVVSAHSERVFGKPALVATREYEEASRAYWFEILRHFPADVVTRAMAASDGVLNLAFENRGPDFLDADLPGQAVFERVLAQVRRLDGLGAAFGAALIVSASLVSAREGLFAMMWLLALTGYPSLEFERRHVFHLQFIPVLGGLVVAYVGSLAVRDAFRDHRTACARWLRLAPRAAVAAVLTMVVLFVPIVVLRQYQAAHLRRLFGEYIAAARTPVHSTFTDLGHGVSRLEWSGMQGTPSSDGRRSSGYFVADVEGDVSAPLVALGVRYWCACQTDLSSVVTISTQPGTNHLFLPVYREPGLLEFRGLEIPSERRGRIRGLYRVDDIGTLPLPLDLALPSQWVHERLYETLQLQHSRFLTRFGVTNSGS